MASRLDITNKSLGQHWLTDPTILSRIAEPAHISNQDVVLEIGPGLGTLTNVLCEQAKSVIAVEFDRHLAQDLTKKQISNLTVLKEDFLQFDLNQLPMGYKVVANIPYYITAKIVQKLLTAGNKPAVAVLLVQKEVAERLAAEPGDMSILAVSAQIYAEVSLGDAVPAAFFTPPPKVDSQVVILKTLSKPRFAEFDERAFFRAVKAGFSARRKKLRSSIAGGLGVSKPAAEELLAKSNIDPNLRAQDLSLADWQNLAKNSIISE